MADYIPLKTLLNIFVCVFLIVLYKMFATILS